MDEPLTIVLALLLGLVSGFMGALSAGGGLVSISGLILLGLSPASAIATSRLDSLAADISSFAKYKKSGLIDMERSLVLVGIALAGGLIGSLVLLQLDERYLEKIVGLLLVALAIFVAFRKELGAKDIVRGRRRQTLGLVMVFAASVFTGLFGGGGGIFFLYILVYFFGMTFLRATANRRLATIAATGVALIVFISAGIVDFSFGVPLIIGALAGGYAGAVAAIRQGNEFLRIVFLIFVAASGIKLLFF